MSKVASCIWNLVLMAGALLALALGLALLGGGYDSHLDMLNHLAPGIIGGQLLSATLAATGARKVRKIALSLCLCGVFMTSLRLAPELWAAASAPRSPARAGQMVRLLDWNVWVKNVDPEGSAALIRRYRPDVITLQEAEAAGAGVPARLSDAYPYRARCRGCDIYILSRWPIRRWDAEVDSWNRGSGRPATTVWAEIAPPGQAPFTVVTTHYDHPNTHSRQAAQRAYLAALLTAFDPETTVFAADMNLTPWSFAMQRQDSAIPLQRVTRALASWPARLDSGRAFPLPLLPIDHVYAGAAWKVVSVQRGARGGSDHYPIIATLTR